MSKNRVDCEGEEARGSKSGVSRRQLLTAGAASAIGLVAVPSAAAGADPEEVDPETAEIATVTAVTGNQLRLRMRDGSDVELVDPEPRESWEVGQEAVVVRQLTDGEWGLVDVQRLYRPIEDAEVTELEENTLETTVGDLELTEESLPRSEEYEGFAAVPLDSIEVGDHVSGIGHRSGAAGELTVDQYGVKSS